MEVYTSTKLPQSPAVVPLKVKFLHFFSDSVPDIDISKDFCLF